jgi:hypothetical protein
MSSSSPFSSSFVLRPGVDAIVGNMKHPRSTALRHRPEDARGSNFTGVSLPNGARVAVREVCTGAGGLYAQVTHLNGATAETGWIRCDNLHVQAGASQAEHAQLYAQFDTLDPARIIGRRALVGQTRHKSGCTALRHEPDARQGDNFTGHSIQDGSEVKITAAGPTKYVRCVEISTGQEGWIAKRNIHVQYQAPVLAFSSAHEVSVDGTLITATGSPKHGQNGKPTAVLHRALSGSRCRFRVVTKCSTARDSGSFEEMRLGLVSKSAYMARAQRAATSHSGPAANLGQSWHSSSDPETGAYFLCANERRCDVRRGGIVGVQNATARVQPGDLVTVELGKVTSGDASGAHTARFWLSERCAEAKHSAQQPDGYLELPGVPASGDLHFAVQFHNCGDAVAVELVEDVHVAEAGGSAAPDDSTLEAFSTRMRGIESMAARLAPISGWESVELVELGKATEGLPVKDLPIHVKVALEVGEDYKDDHPDDPRTEHQLGAIHLYTQGWAIVSHSLYAVLNETLASQDRTLLVVWFFFLKLLMTALACEPRYVGTVWRGVAADIGGEYKKGKKVRWWRFSSCTEDGDVLQKPMFLGDKGKRTLFSIDCTSGVNIQHLSAYPEAEVQQPSPSPPLPPLHLSPSLCAPLISMCVSTCVRAVCV